MPHLFELEDLPGFPSVLRRQQVEFIGWLVDRFGIYESVVPLIGAAVAHLGNARVTDLGSGSGGPIHYLARQSELSPVEFLLSDRYPARAANSSPTTHLSTRPTTNPRVAWHPEPVDAGSGELPGDGLLTLFNAFHHFTTAQQRQLVKSNASRGILVVEVLQPTPLTFFKILFTTTVGQLLLAPFVRPFRWERLLFTYLLPINLITIPWDGLVSVLRSSHAATLLQALQSAVPAGHTLAGGTVGPWWAPVTWVRCLPERHA
jgi:hypothetical protein